MENLDNMDVSNWRASFQRLPTHMKDKHVD